jgi:iron complex transport system permease protein
VTALLERPAAPDAVRTARRAWTTRLRTTWALLAVAVLVVFAVDVLLGRYPVPLPDLVRIASGEVVPPTSFILLQDKLPRAVVGLLVGLAFGASGATFQTMLRNPLASPDVLGVTSGASAFAVFAIVVLGVTGRDVSWWALGGAGVVAVALHVLSRGVAGQRLVLAGIGLAAVLTAVTSHLLARSTIRTAAEVLVWLNGSLSSSTWDRATDLALALAVLLPALAWLSRGLDGLGPRRRHRVGPRRPACAAPGSGLLPGLGGARGVATAAAGPVAFVAFLSGPIARRLLGGRRVARRVRPRRRAHRPVGRPHGRERLRHAPARRDHHRRARSTVPAVAARHRPAHRPRSA